MNDIPPKPRPRRIARLWRIGRWPVLGLLGALGLYLGIEQLIGNFHTVVPGELYRSAQLDARDIQKIKAEYGIRTIINLRGATSAKWHEEEVATSDRLGITHIDFGLSAGRELTDQQVDDLLDILQNAPKPILVHCRGGADRSGIASALYLAAIVKAGEEAAEWQLSLFYGHFPIPFAPAWAMDETFERLEPWLGYPDS